MTNSKQEYDFEKFLKKFFPSEYHEREKESDPYELGVSISQNALTKMDNLLKCKIRSKAHSKSGECRTVIPGQAAH